MLAAVAGWDLAGFCALAWCFEQEVYKDAAHTMQELHKPRESNVSIKVFP
jgi:hypothetical protein